MSSPKDNEDRISNLRNLLNNVKNVDENEKEEYEDSYTLNLENKNDSSDENLINYFEKNETEKSEIDDEFIFKPSKNNDNYKILEDENSEPQINDDFIIKTGLDEEDNSSYKSETSESEEDIEKENDKINKEFDTIINYKIGKVQIIPILGTVVGILSIIFGILLLIGNSQKVVDNVISGETSVLAMILFFMGAILLIISLYKLLPIKNPFQNLTNSIKKIEKDQLKKPAKKEKNYEEEKESRLKELTDQPIDRDSYKIGEFKVPSLKKGNKEKTKPNKTVDSKNNEKEDKFFEDVEEIEEIGIVSIDEE